MKTPTPTRVPLSIAKTLVAATKDEGLTLSRAVEKALAAAPTAARNRRWNADNRDMPEGYRPL